METKNKTRNQGAEEALLSFLLGYGTFDAFMLCSQSGIDRTHFTNERRVIFGAISDVFLKNRSFDVIQVLERLIELDKVEAAGGHAYLREIENKYKCKDAMLDARMAVLWIDRLKFANSGACNTTIDGKPLTEQEIHLVRQYRDRVAENWKDAGFFWITGPEMDLITSLRLMKRDYGYPEQEASNASH